MRLSEEQLAVVNSNKEHITVNAGPGTGKTTLLLAIAKANPDRRHLILCFNATIKEEIEEKLKKQGINNAIVKTFHGLAYSFFKTSKVNYFASFTKRRLDENLDYFFMFETMKKLGFVDRYMDFRIEDTMTVLRRFFSSSKKLEDCLDETIVDKRTVEYCKSVLQFIATNKDCPMFHELYIKRYQMLKPTLPEIDTILVDEYQDVSECYLDIINSISEGKRTVRVGDTYQKIYGYNGAVGMKECDFKLTVSYRVGKDTSDYCNNLISKFFDNPILLNGVNANAKFGTCPEDNYVKIFRTNKALMLELLESMKNGKRIVISQKTIDELSFYKILIEKIRDYKSRYKGIPINGVSDLEYIYSLSKDSRLKRFISLSSHYSYDELIEILSHEELLIPEDKIEDEKHIRYITAHRCKGLEFSYVKIAEDYPDEEKMIDNMDEVYIKFVAMTRSNKILELC
jgi:helicase, uvrD/REP family